MRENTILLKATLTNIYSMSQHKTINGAPNHSNIPPSLSYIPSLFPLLGLTTSTTFSFFTHSSILSSSDVNVDALWRNICKKSCCPKKKKREGSQEREGEQMLCRNEKINPRSKLGINKMYRINPYQHYKHEKPLPRLVEILIPITFWGPILFI